MKTKLVLPNPEGAKKLRESRKKASNLEEQLSKFTEELEKGYIWSVSQLPVAEIRDLYLAYNHLFSRAAKRAVPFEKDDTAGVAYLTCMAVGEENVIKAAEEVIAAVNGLAKHGYVTGFLQKLSSVKMHSEPHEEEKWVVLSFPSLTPDGHIFLKRTKWGVITEENQEVSKFQIRT